MAAALAVHTLDRPDLDEAGIAELEGVGGQVQQDTGEGDGVADPDQPVRNHEAHLEALLLGNRLDDVGFGGNDIDGESFGRDGAGGGFFW